MTKMYSVKSADDLANYFYDRSKRSFDRSERDGVAATEKKLLQREGAIFHEVAEMIANTEFVDWHPINH